METGESTRVVLLENDDLHVSVEFRSDSVRFALWQYRPRRLEGGIWDATVEQALTWSKVLGEAGLHWFIRVLEEMSAGRNITSDEFEGIRAKEVRRQSRDRRRKSD